MELEKEHVALMKLSQHSFLNLVFNYDWSFQLELL